MVQDPVLPVSVPAVFATVMAEGSWTCTVLVQVLLSSFVSATNEEGSTLHVDAEFTRSPAAVGVAVSVTVSVLASPNVAPEAPALQVRTRVAATRLHDAPPDPAGEPPETRGLPVLRA